MGEERTARSARRGFGSEGEGNEDITKQGLGRIWGTESDSGSSVQGTQKCIGANSLTSLIIQMNII